MAALARAQKKLNSVISAVNLVLCVTGSASAGPVGDPLRILRPLAEQRDVHAEMSSADAVWAAHPGSHAVWTLRLPGHEGEKCWLLRDSTNLPAPRVRNDGVVNSPRGAEADPRTDGQTKRASSQAKASAVDRVDQRPPRSASQNTMPPSERGPSSILIWAGRCGLMRRGKKCLRSGSVVRSDGDLSTLATLCPGRRRQVGWVEVRCICLRISRVPGPKRRAASVVGNMHDIRMQGARGGASRRLVDMISDAQSHSGVEPYVEAKKGKVADWSWPWVCGGCTAPPYAAN